METTQEKLLQSCNFCPVTRDPDPNNGVKMQQKLLLGIVNNKDASTHKVT